MPSDSDSKHDLARSLYQNHPFAGALRSEASTLISLLSGPVRTGEMSRSVPHSGEMRCVCVCVLGLVIWHFGRQKSQITLNQTQSILPAGALRISAHPSCAAPNAVTQKCERSLKLYPRQPIRRSNMSGLRAKQRSLYLNRTPLTTTRN